MQQCSAPLAAVHFPHSTQVAMLSNEHRAIVKATVPLQILPEHYPIVGRCLLRAIREVLGAEVATDAVLEAWSAAYQQLADILIGLEEARYADRAQAPGGWR